MEKSTQKKIEKFLSGYYGKELKEQVDLGNNPYGFWKVEGEDPNCDMGGPHHNPHIGYYKGYLRDVLKIAVEHPKFWSWGWGGKVTYIVFEEVS